MDAAISVIIPAHTEKRWDALVEAVESVRRQTRPPVETIVVIDHNEQLRARAEKELAPARVVGNPGRRGASGARNAGVAAARGELIAFLDDDAVADAGWLEALCAPLAEGSVLGTGGGVRPLWPVAAPAWFPDEFGWVVGASYRGMPEKPAPVRNVWGLNMAMRRDVFLSAGGFRDGFGKLGDHSRPEDTELCVRVQQAHPGGHWLYVPGALVGHRVPANRTSARFFLVRCWHEGLGKAELAALLGTGDATSSERDYVRRVLPRGVGQGLRDSVAGRDPAGLSRAGAIVAGLTVTAAGMAAGRMAVRLPGRRAADAPPAPAPPAPAPPASAPPPAAAVAVVRPRTSDRREPAAETGSRPALGEPMSVPMESDGQIGTVFTT